MNTIIQLDESGDKSQRFKAFRKQFAENLNLALDRKGAIPIGYGRVTAVAELFSVSQNTAANWLKGDGVPELGRLPEIAETLNTTVQDLVIGSPNSGAHVIDERYAVIDLHDGAEDGGHTIYTLPETLRQIGLPRNVKILRIHTDDMEPYVRTGDLIVYDSRVNHIHTNGVFVLSMAGNLFVRRVQRGMKDTVRLICDNERFDAETLTATDFSDVETDDGRITVVGAVVGRLLIGR